MVVRAKNEGSEGEKRWLAEAVATEAWNVNAEEFVCCCLSRIMSLLCLTKQVIHCFFLLRVGQ